VNIQQRLRALSEEVGSIKTELRILEEQIEFQTTIADDARLRAVVSETPLADREAQEASGDLARLIRSQDDARSRLDGLRAEQDSLLERMLER
jgi:hypothetical protein